MGRVGGRGGEPWPGLRRPVAFVARARRHVHIAELQFVGLGAHQIDHDGIEVGRRYVGHALDAGGAGCRAPGAARPMLPPDVPQHFVPLRGSKSDGSELVYAPMLLGVSQIHFSDAKSGVETTQDVTAVTPMTDGAIAVDWDKAALADVAVDDLESSPAEGANFLPLPASAGKAKSYEGWNKDFSGWLFRTQKVEVLKSPSTKEVSKPGESERDFRARLQQSGRESRDKGADALRQKYAPKIAALLFLNVGRLSLKLQVSFVQPGVSSFG